MNCNNIEYVYLKPGSYYILWKDSQISEIFLYEGKEINCENIERIENSTTSEICYKSIWKV